VSTTGPALTDGLATAGPEMQAALFGMYDALRAQTPAFQVPELGFWLVTRYEDVHRILSDPQTFSSHYPERFGTGLSLGPASERAAEVLATGYPWELTLLFHDPPRHTRHRNLIGQAFTPKRVRKMEPVIAELAHTYLDRLPAQGGPVDFVEAFAGPLPISVVADALGVDRDDIAQFKRWSDDIVIRLGSMLPEERDVELMHEYVDYQRYFADRIEQRRRSPKDDLLSDLVAARVAGEDPLTVPEMLSLITLVLVAGNETTTSLMATMMRILIEHPEQEARIRADRGLLPGFIEETLRMEAPLQMFFRKVTRDVSIGGVAVPAGEMLMVSFGAANRDPAKYACPAQFDQDRAGLRDHLAFGWGPHFCPGSSLTRAEARVAYNIILDRIDSFRFAPDYEQVFQPNFITRVPMRLPVVISPVRPRPA